MVLKNSLVRKPKIKFLAISMGLLAVGVGQVSAGHQIYYSQYGTDNVMFYSNSKKCFTTLRGVCASGVQRLNPFAVESGGILYCDINTTPVLDKPIVEFGGLGTSQTVVSTCTSQGWRTLPF